MNDREQIDTADHVHHAPTGEDWVVAYVEGDRLAWSTKKATAAERRSLLDSMAELAADHRGNYARRVLAAAKVTP